MCVASPIDNRLIHVEDHLVIVVRLGTTAKCVAYARI